MKKPVVWRPADQGEWRRRRQRRRVV